MVPINAVLVHYFIRQVNAGVAVAEPSHVLHLPVTQSQQHIPLCIVHVHDVKHRLNALKQ